MEITLEKIELVKHLDKLGVGVIEVSPITSPVPERQNTSYPSGSPLIGLEKR